MAKMRKPRQPELLPPVLTHGQLEAVLGTCKGDAFRDRRDAAILRLLVGTGARLSEVAGLTIEDVDLDEGTTSSWARVDASARRTYGTKASRAMDRYARKRRERPLGRLARLVARDARADDRVGHQPGRQGPWCPGRRPRAPRPCLPALLRPQHARPGHAGRRPHGRGRLAQPGDAGSLRAATRFDRAIAASRRLNPGDELVSDMLKAAKLKAAMEAAAHKL